MADRYEQVEMRVGLTNTTSRYLLVGNYRLIISNHATREEAVEAAEAIGSRGPDGLAGTPYCSVDVLAPGESIDGKVMAPVIWDDGREASWDDLFAHPAV